MALCSMMTDKPAELYGRVPLDEEVKITKGKLVMTSSILQRIFITAENGVNYDERLENGTDMAALQTLK